MQKHIERCGKSYGKGSIIPGAFPVPEGQIRVGAVDRDALLELHSRVPPTADSMGITK